MKQSRYLDTAVFSLGIAFCLMPAVGQAATFNIADGDVAGLKTAISTANATPGAHTINLAPNGTYILTAIDNDGFYGPSGLHMTGQITMNGRGATIRRSSDSGTPAFRVLLVEAAKVTLDGITLTGGQGDTSRGGVGSGGGLMMAGSCCTQSEVLLRNSTITGNYGIEGGGIANFAGILVIENSTVSYNTGFGGRTGGGILNASFYGPGFATTAINFSTIFENRADGPPGFEGRGDAIADAFSPAGSITVKNSILASPTRGAGATCVFFTPISGGHNIADDASCGLTGTGDMNNTDPLLGPTASNGGPTPTHLPAVNSPAIDAVPLSYCTDVLAAPITTDQRGVSRPQRAACDIGSVEVAAPLYHLCFLYDPTRAVPKGAVVPIKLQLCDATGNDLSASTKTLHATSVTQVSTSISGPVQDAGNANPDNDFRFDSTLGPTGGYIFNLSTKGLATGSYNLNFTVTGDPSVYAAPFQVK